MILPSIIKWCKNIKFKVVFWNRKIGYYNLTYLIDGKTRKLYNIYNRVKIM